MTHINDKIAEYVFEELSKRDMAEAKGHVAECSACREQVEKFRSTYAMLKTSPDLDPPRPTVFEFEKATAPSWIWRWLGPMAASAAVALAVVSFAPRPQIVERVIQQPAPQATTQAATQPAIQPVDYQRIINELRPAEQAWLETELKKRDAAHAAQLQSVRADVASIYLEQQRLQWETRENGGSIQKLAALTDTRK
jgi:Putative zinc-finger